MSNLAAAPIAPSQAAISFAEGSKTPAAINTTAPFSSNVGTYRHPKLYHLLYLRSGADLIVHSHVIKLKNKPAEKFQLAY
jgi:hypothetical protein